MRILPRAWGERGRRAFTLTEVIVSMGLFVMVIGGVILAHLFAIRMFEIAKAKLGAGASVRKAINEMVSDIRGCSKVIVGQGTASSFTECTFGTPQQGNAIQIYQTTDTNTWTRYYLNTNNKALYRLTSSTAQDQLIPNCISNTMVFTTEDYNGTVHTNDWANRVVGMTLQFSQIQYPIVNIGPGQFYDFYQLRTRITKRIH